MANIKKAKARKEYTCSNCGKIIPKGSEYLRGEPFRKNPIIRCTACGLQSWELSSSEYVQNIGRLCNKWEDDYGLENIDGIMGELEEIKDECENNLYNMPEGLQYGDVGTLLQERIDELESAINDLEGVDVVNIQEQTFNELCDETREQIADILNKEVDSVDVAEDYLNLIENYPNNKAVAEWKDYTDENILTAVTSVLENISY